MLKDLWCAVFHGGYWKYYRQDGVMTGFCRLCSPEQAKRLREVFTRHVEQRTMRQEARDHGKRARGYTESKGLSDRS